MKAATEVFFTPYPVIFGFENMQIVLMSGSKGTSGSLRYLDRGGQVHCKPMLLPPPLADVGTYVEQCLL